MTALATPPRIVELQQRVHRMEGAALTRALPVVPALSGLLQLRTGTVCAVDSPALALAVLAGPSGAGEWVAMVGVPDLGLEAAAELGVDLTRTVLVPEPGEHWLSVTAGLVDVASVVLVRPPVGVSEAQAARLVARLRQKDAALVALGEWPRSAVRLVTAGSRWSGLGCGHGHLTSRQLTVTVHSNVAPPRHALLQLGGSGAPVRRLTDEPVPYPCPVSEAG